MRICLKGRHCRLICAALGNLSFSVGLIMLPALAAADLSVWARCRDLDRSACIELLERSQLLAETAELGGDIQVLPAFGPARYDDEAARWFFDWGKIPELGSLTGKSAPRPPAGHESPPARWPCGLVTQRCPPC